MRASTFFILLVLVLAIVGIHQARSTVTYVPPMPARVRNQQHRADDDNPGATSQNKNKQAAAAPNIRPHAPEAAQPAPPKEPLWKAEISGQGTSPQAARQEAIKNAAEKLSAHLRARYPDFKYIPSPQFLIDQKMVDEGRDEKMTLSDPAAPEVTLHTLVVEMREDHLNQLLVKDRQERGHERLWEAGHVLGGLLVMLIALVGYVRLDDWTKGYFSLPLKLGALSLAVAGPVVCWWLI
jgi:hypothetical protein